MPLRPGTPQPPTRLCCPLPSPPPASPLIPAPARTRTRLTLLDHPSAGRRGVLHHLLHKDAIIPLGDGQPMGAAALPVGQQQLPGCLLLFLHLFGITKQSSGQWGWKAMEWGTVSKVPASAVGKLPRHKGQIGNGPVDATTTEVISPSPRSKPHPPPCSVLQPHSGLYPPHSPPAHLPLPPTDLRRTWVRSGCLARSPPLLPLLSSGYLLGISVTLSRGKVTIRFSLNRWLARSPTPAALQERWLDVLSTGAKPKPQPRYCHQLRSHVTLQGWDHGKELWKRPDSDSNLGTASCQLCDPGQIT